MESTCRKGDCPLYKKYHKRCPNRVEGWWKPPPKPGEIPKQPILIADCAPIKTFLMLQQISQQLVGFQKAQEQQRNVTTKLLGVFAQITQTMAEKAGLELEHKEDDTIEGEAKEITDGE